MNDVQEGDGFEIVRRRGFLRRHLSARGPPSADGEGRAARPVRHRHVARAWRTHSPDHRRFRPRRRHHHAGGPGGRQDDTRRCSRPAGPGRTCMRWSGRWASPRISAHAKKVVCVGGGLGVAPIYPQARAFKEGGAYVIGILGFRNKGLVFWEDKFRACCDEVILCTDDGSAGLKGFVSDGIRAGARRPPRHRRGGRDRPAGDDEGLRRDHAAARHQDHGQPQPDHG